MKNVKKADAVELPFKMDLQLFGEGDPAPEPAADPTPEPQNPSPEPVNPDNEPAPTSGVADPVKDEPASDKDTTFKDDPQNKAFAEMRRKTEAAEKKAQLAERNQDIARKYGQYGVYSEEDIANKYGESNGITTLEQFEEALQREEYKEKGIDYDTINKIVDNHPAVKAARKAEYDNKLVSSYDELHTEYPGLVKDPNDIPTEVWQKWNDGKNGLSLLEAYELTNRKQIRENLISSAKQQTLNNVNGKEHIRGDEGGSEVETTTIPEDVLKMYKKLNPGKTDEEYLKHYKNSK